jgi:hypothetical protein
VRNLGAARNGGIAIWNMTGIVASTTGAGGGVVPKLLHMDWMDDGQISESFRLSTTPVGCCWVQCSAVGMGGVVRGGGGSA